MAWQLGSDNSMLDILDVRGYVAYAFADTNVKTITNIIGTNTVLPGYNVLEITVERGAIRIREDGGDPDFTATPPFGTLHSAGDTFRLSSFSVGSPLATAATYVNKNQVTVSGDQHTLAGTYAAVNDNLARITAAVYSSPNTTLTFDIEIDGSTTSITSLTISVFSNVKIRALDTSTQIHVTFYRSRVK